MRRRLSRQVGVLAVAAALVTACGSDDPGGGQGGAASDAGEPRVGGSMTVLQNYEAPTLDPAVLLNQLPTNPLVGNALYGQLLTVDAEGTVEYGLAESLETSDGGTTWQLTLREGLTFSDGSTFDAAAVEFNWQRLKDPATRSPQAQYAGLLESTTASGRTLDFALTRPIGQFGSVIAHQMNWIASPEALRAGPQALSENPVGAGPFVLESWQRGGQMVLTRNENYHEDSLPRLDELVVVTNNDSEQRLSTVVSGGAQGALISSADQLVRAEEQGLRVTRADLGGDATFFTYNTRRAPFDDARARRAVSQAIDWDAVNAAVYSGNGEVPETWFPEDSERNGDATLAQYDPEAAQELFDELADEGRAVTFVITSPQSTEPRRTSEAVQAQLSQYDNVSVELEVLDSATVRTKTAQHDYDAGFTGLFVDPVGMYNTFHSESPANVTGIADPALDEALVALLEATDPAVVTEAYQAVAAALADAVPGYPYIRNTWGMAHTASMAGVEFYGDASPLVDTLWLAG